MVEQQVLLGVLAIAIGFVVGVVLFVPFVAVSYRRRGTLTAGRFLLWAGALVSFWAIWTYTLLPLPEVGEYACAGANLDPWAFVDDIRGAVARAGGEPLRAVRDFAVLQLLLNVLLFVPLGFFLRVLGGRGVVVAVLAGLGVSLLVETTQATGVWGLYPCAYRVFDVDDLATNTLGALLGSVLALVVPRAFRGAVPDDVADRPRPVTRSRRLLAVLVDGLGLLVVGGALTLAVQGWLLLLHDPAARSGTAAAVGGAAAAVIWLLPPIITGRTVGDLCVRIRYAGGPLPRPLARLLRLLGGIGGYALLGVLPGPGPAFATLLVVLAVVLTLTTGQGRGLPGLLSGQRPVDVRADPVDTPSPGVSARP